MVNNPEKAAVQLRPSDEYIGRLVAEVLQAEERLQQLRGFQAMPYSPYEPAVGPLEVDIYSQIQRQLAMQRKELEGYLERGYLPPDYALPLHLTERAIPPVHDAWKKPK